MQIIYKSYIYESITDYDDEDIDNESEVDEDDEEEEYDPNDDDPHPIDKLKQDDEHKYQYFNHVMYRLGYNNNDFALNIDQIEATPGNTFYPEQIDKYEKYIREGGIIDTFPVRVSPLAYDLKSMLDYCDEVDIDSTNGDELYNIRKGTILEDITFLYELYMDNDEGEEFYKYNRINKHARRLEDVFPPDNRTPEELELMEALSHIFKFFEENKDYTLTEMNHRFEAIKRLGITAVLVEPLN